MSLHGPYGQSHPLYRSWAGIRVTTPRTHREARAAFADVTPPRRLIGRHDLAVRTLRRHHHAVDMQGMVRGNNSSAILASRKNSEETQAGLTLPQASAEPSSALPPWFLLH